MRGLVILSVALAVVLMLFSMMQSLSGVTNSNDTESVQKVIAAPEFIDIDSLNLPTDYTLPAPPRLPKSAQYSSTNSLPSDQNTLNRDQLKAQLELSEPSLESLSGSAQIKNNLLQPEPNPPNKN